MIEAYLAHPLVALKIDYDPAIIAAIMAIPGAEWSHEKKRWFLSMAAFESLYETLGAGEFALDPSVKGLSCVQEALATKPDYISPALVLSAPTWHQTTGIEGEGVDYQAAGISWLVGRDSGILADDMGLGKTYMAIQAVRQFPGRQMILVIAKASVLEQWRDEINRFDPEALTLIARGPKRMEMYQAATGDGVCSRTYLVMSFETFRADAEVVKNIHFAWTFIDEAHKIKSSPLNGEQSQIAQAVHLIRSDRRFALTGTPLVQSPADAWNTLRWIGIEKRSWPQFEMDTLVTQTVRVGTSRYGPQRKKIIRTKPEGMKTLRRMLNKCMIRRVKSEVLDLPSVIHTTIPVVMSPDAAREYRGVQKTGIFHGAELPNEEVMVLRLRQITTRAKLDEAVNLVQDWTAAGHKVLVFSQWLEAVAYLAKALWDYMPAVITGSVSTDLKGDDRSARQLQIDQFQNNPNCHVLIGTSSSCREGLNLTAGTVLIHVDKEWSPKYVEQLEARANRIGSTESLQVISLEAVYLDSKGETHTTIDSGVEANLATKSTRIHSLVR